MMERDAAKDKAELERVTQFEQGGDYGGFTLRLQKALEIGQHYITAYSQEHEARARAERALRLAICEAVAGRHLPVPLEQAVAIHEDRLLGLATTWDEGLLAEKRALAAKETLTDGERAKLRELDVRLGYAVSTALAEEGK